MDFDKILESEHTFDPENWDEMEQLAHVMITDIFAHLKGIRDKPVWTKPTKKVSTSIFGERLPQKPQSIHKIYDKIKADIFPYNKGNIHPKFWSWVQSTGTPFSVLAEMLTAGLNPDVCTGDHAPMYIESQTIDWLKKLFEFPETGSGVLVSGTSMANLTALLIARDACTHQTVREKGLYQYDSQMVLYASVETHSCITKAADIIGLGKEAVRLIKTDDNFRIDIEELNNQIHEDKNAGLVPFCVVANVGTVNTGAIDPLSEIATICKKEKLWLHIDGAFGAFAKLVPEFKELLKPIEEADSIAFDLHKWMSLPVGIGCVLVKDREAHRNAFAIQPNYLQVHERGLASGFDPIFNWSIEMTRSFSSLKVWMHLKEQGVEKIAHIVRQNIAQVLYLENLIKREPKLELITPVTMNVICFRFNPRVHLGEERLDKLNKEIVIHLQENGLAVTSHAYINGKYVIRLANVNHRSTKADFEQLVKDIVYLGNELKPTI